MNEKIAVICREHHSCKNKKCMHNKKHEAILNCFSWAICPYKNSLVAPCRRI